MIESVTHIEKQGYLLIECSGTIENIEEWKKLDKLTSDIIMTSEFNKFIIDERNVIHIKDVNMICD